jgi:DNA repair photolyase
VKPIGSRCGNFSRKLNFCRGSPRPRQELAAVETSAKVGVPVGVLVAPVIPALNDHEIPAVLAAAKAAGAGWAYTEIVRLPLTVAPVFEEWLERHFPEKKEKILGRICHLRGGRLNDSRFGARMQGEGLLADQIHPMFEVARRKAGIPEDGPELSAAAFSRPQGPQLSLDL